jgi:DNA-directed RNA polymerase specialized sigma24 family protein
MKQAFNNIPSVSLTSLTYINDLTVAEQKTRKYGPLLHKIALSFGFHNRESWELVQQVCLLAYQRDAKQEICFPLKVFLAKDLVHRCIFKISSQLFSQNNTDMAYFSNYRYTGELCLQKMPLSLAVVYLLNSKFNFNEVEIAEILYTTPVQVKERLHKASAFVKNHK